MGREAIRVLLIEDNPGDAKLVGQMLNKSENPEFDVQHVEDLQSGVERLKSQHFDVLLLDLGLPDGAGLETVSKALAAAPDVPIIVLSGAENPQTILESIKGGVQDYLMKSSIRAEALIETVARETASVSWKIRLSKEDLASLRRIAEEIGRSQLVPQPSVSALLHKAVQSYIEAWTNRLPPAETTRGHSRTF